MTENEAIKNVTAYVYMECENMPSEVIKALDIMKDATKEIQAYGAIGTVEECRDAVERMKPKKIVDLRNEKNYRAGQCPRCGKYIIQPTSANGCIRCLQRVKWNE